MRMNQLEDIGRTSHESHSIFSMPLLCRPRFAADTLRDGASTVLPQMTRSEVLVSASAGWRKLASAAKQAALDQLSRPPSDCLSRCRR